MWEVVSNFVNDRLSPIETLMSFVEFVIVIWIFVKVSMGQKRREKRIMGQLRQTQGVNPAILVVDLNPRKNIHLDVEKFRQADPELKVIPSERVKVIQRNKDLRPEDIPEVVKDVRKVIVELGNEAVGLIHLFYSGPSAVPAILGAELVNGCRVLLYQHQPGEGGYENWGPLRNAII